MRSTLALLLLLFCSIGCASELPSDSLNLSSSWVGYLSVLIFAVAYLLVVLEDVIHLRKSKPVMLAAGLIWLLIAIAYTQNGTAQLVGEGIRHTFLEFAELFFFLLVAMTYISAMMERGVFESLRNFLVEKGFSYRSLFWLTGTLSFFISPLADNLTTALIMCAVIMTVSNGKKGFVPVCCINIVVAANAGGAFSPFGDITTLMVWQKGVVDFLDFFALFLPSVVNFVIPALFLQFAVPKGRPPAIEESGFEMKHGGRLIVWLFIATIVTAIAFHHFLYLPPVFGMMTGLAYLKFYGYRLRTKAKAWTHGTENPPGSEDDPYNFDVFAKIAHAEWDTLFFFYGVIMAVGGLGYIGYLEFLSGYFYGELGATQANIVVGLLSALVDNIPVMYAVLSMEPDMSHAQWLLVTLTAGVGGSLLSIGSAAGVALMGQTRGQYTFLSHLRWSPVIALGYAASIWLHLVLTN